MFYDKPEAREVLLRLVAAHTGDEAERRVAEFVSSGLIEVRGDRPRPYKDEHMWSPDRDRRYGRLAHGFLFAADWLGVHGALEEAERSELANAITDLVATWQDNYASEASMAFHDETTAQRVMYLAATWRLFSDSMQERESVLLQRIADDVELLLSDEFHAGSNNHGMFQDIAILFALTFGAVPDDGTRFDVAFGRLFAYFDSCFTSEGIHVENSPTYHLMVCRHLRTCLDYAVSVGKREDVQEFADLLPQADRYAAFALSPNCAFPPVSDNRPVRVSPAAARDAFGDGYLVGATTRGAEGALPEGKAFVAPKSGYAIFKDGWTEEASQVYFSAAYNADYHKHSDEMSLYLVHRGREILREAGPYGYDRRDPFTAYAFSSFAHNTLIVDGRGLPRTDYKSHLTRMSDLGTSSSHLHVKGITHRFDGVAWERTLSVSSAGTDAPVAISDSVRSEHSHTYTFLWHVAKGLELVVRGNAIEFFESSTSVKLAELTWIGTPPISVRTVRGAKEPEIQGWEFPTMGAAVPAPVVEVAFEGNDVDVMWELRTAEFKIRDRGVLPSASEWRTFQGEKPVHYLLESPADDSPKELLVVLSAIHQPGDFTFNYRSSLQHSRAAKLYILDDFGDQGAYYYSSSRDLCEYRSVQGLIHSVLRELRLCPEDTSFLGSSKGGSAALIHGLALGARRIICAAPQTLIGSFLREPHPNILRYMAGGTRDSDVRWLDGAVERALRSGVRSTQIQVLIGKADHHFRGHILPMADRARALGYGVDVMALPGTPHQQIGTLFQRYLRTLVAFESSNTQDALAYPHAVGFDPKTRQLGIEVRGEGRFKVGYQLFRDGQPAEKFSWSKTLGKTWNISAPGQYRVRVHVRDDESDRRDAFGTRSITVAH